MISENQPSEMDTINILFTSAGRRVQLIRAFKQAYSDLALKGNIIGADIDALAPALSEVDRSYIVPRLTEPSYIPALRQICQEEGVHLLFPLIDPDIPILAANRAILESTGARVVVAPLEAVRTVSDKWETYQFFRLCGIPTAETWLPNETEQAGFQFPLFIKPRFGSASNHTYKVSNADELAFFRRYVPDPIIQEYLPGPEITNDVVCGFDGNVLGVVSRRRIEVRAGEVSKGVTVYDPAIIEYCRVIAAKLKAIGPITIQCMLQNGGPIFTEINVRFGGGAPLGIAANMRSPQWLLALASNRRIEIPPLGTYKKGLYLTRFDDSFVLDESEHARIAGGRL